MKRTFFFFSINSAPFKEPT